MLLVLQHHLEEAYRFPGGSCPTGADVLRGKCPGGKCPKGQISHGDECPGVDVQGANVLRGRCPTGANVRGRYPGDR